MLFPKVPDENANCFVSGRLANALINNINSQQADTQGKKYRNDLDTNVVGAVSSAGEVRPAGWIMGIPPGGLATSVADVDTDMDNPVRWFAMNTVYNVEDYDPEAHKSYVVLLAPAAANDTAVTPAATGGTVKIKVDILDTEHKYATFKSDLPTPGTETPVPAQLETAASGEFEIITIPTDPDTGDTLDGEQWCTVRFPVSQGGGGTVIEVVQVKAVDEMNAEVQVAPITLLLDELPNYESSDDDYFWKTVNFLKDE